MASLGSPAGSKELRIGYQKGSTLTAILKTNGELEKMLAPLGITVSWHDFISGPPLLEAIDIGGIDFSADVATPCRSSRRPPAQACLCRRASGVTRSRTTIYLEAIDPSARTYDAVARA